MENNEIAVVEEVETVKAAENSQTVEVIAAQPQSKAKQSGFKAKAKEWFRKKIVNLKRKPQNIALFVLAISSIFYLLSLSTLSPGPTQDFSSVTWLGFCIFVNSLFSILVLVLYIGIFPKHPKVNKKTGKKSYVSIPKIVLTVLFIAAMIAMDILYYVILKSQIDGNPGKFFPSAEEALKYNPAWDLTNVKFENYKPYLFGSLSVCIAHIVLVGISAILLATMPLYKKLIMKIDTSKQVDFSNAKEVIDIEE